jgi:regulator of RNase E activity RraA
MTSVPRSDESLFATARRELFVAVVGDVLDAMGLQRQFLHPSLRVIDPAMVILGRAMPVVEQDLDAEYPADYQHPLDKPFGVMLEALDDLQTNEVYICAGASHRYALWGGLMSTRAANCGAAGAVVHGFHRDTLEILRLRFPVASFGSYAQDQGPRGRVVAWRVPITVDGVTVAPGDVVFGDCDGMLIIPADALEEAFNRALTKVRSEKTVQQALDSGMSSAAAFAKFGVM